MSVSATEQSPIGRLIETKLMPPRARGDAIARPRLTGKLDGLTGTALTLIVAPVGFGKTVLAQELVPSPGGTGGVGVARRHGR